jgi:hypothetical protein
MPFVGGHSPFPERTGGGDAGNSVPRLQRIIETLEAARGKPFDATQSTLVGAENMAYAVAIDQDGYGANERFACEMNPATSTVLGLLPRWETIFNTPPLYGDSQAVRQGRVKAAMLRFTQENNSLGTTNALTALFGALFTSLTLTTPGEANTWWPGLFGNTGKITGALGNIYTFQNLASVPTDAPGNLIKITNSATNNGTYPIKNWVLSTEVTFVNASLGTSPDYGIGGTSGAPTLGWTLINPRRPFTSTLAHLLALLNPSAVAGMLNADGTLAAKFFAVANQLNTVLDLLSPADETFDWYVNSSHGAIGWYLDEQNLDVLAFDS